MDVKKNAQALRDENERLAREAERRMLDPALSEEAKRAASDEAKVYWQLSRNWADTVADAEKARPSKFTGKNSGTQSKTEQRKAFLEQISESFGTKNREALAKHAVEKHLRNVKKLWPNEKLEEQFCKVIKTFLRNHRIR